MDKKPILTLGLIITSLIATLLGVFASNNDEMLEREPLASKMLVNVHNGIMPWEISVLSKEIELSNPLDNLISQENGEVSITEDNTPASVPLSATTAVVTQSPTPNPTAGSTSSPTPSPTPSLAPIPTPKPTPTYSPRYAPYRGTTDEECRQHISADIYGDDGVRFASSYDFVMVENDYFDDALFIGDSRTVGLKKYTDLSEHADFLCVTSQNVYKALSSDFAGEGTIEDAVQSKKYGKIYIMLGINELGSGTTEDYLRAYTEVVDRIIELSPDSKIIVEAIMKVDKDKNDSDKVFNNANIVSRNNALATLADNDRIFYIDVNEAVCNQDGNLDSTLTFDHIHLMGKSYDAWKKFLLEHGVRIEKEEEY